MTLTKLGNRVQQYQMIYPIADYHAMKDHYDHHCQQVIRPKQILVAILTKDLANLLTATSSNWIYIKKKILSLKFFNFYVHIAIQK